LQFTQPYFPGVYTSTCRINDTTVRRHQSFIEILNEQLIEYLMMRALNAQLLKSFPILRECLSMRLSNPTYFFPYVSNSRCWEILLNLTCSSSTPFGFMPTQTMWNSLRWVWGSSPTSPLNVSSKCIKPYSSSKLTLLSMFIHNGWFSMLGASSSHSSHINWKEKVKQISHKPLFLGCKDTETFEFQELWDLFYLFFSVYMMNEYVCYPILISYDYLF